MIFTTDQMLEAYRRMCRIRYFEEAAENQQKSKAIPGLCHSSAGQEATIVGACMALRDEDYVTGTHRSHGHPIGKGSNLHELMAELLGKDTGICRGRGGSMHFTDFSVGVISETSIVGGGLPIATGAGLSAQIRSSEQVSLCFFGDGAVNQGTFHESINMAVIWKLPVVYFCENNLYALTTSLSDSHGQPDIARRAEGYGIPGTAVDGQDVEAVYEVTKNAVDRARSGKGPTLIEAKTYRFGEHAMGLPSGNYRGEKEVDFYKTNYDPLVLYKNKLLKEGIDEIKLDDVENEVKNIVLDAVMFAQNSAFPDLSDIYSYMYKNPINYPK